MIHNNIVYPNHLVIKDALQLYFSKYHFADGGYQDANFKIKIGPWFLSFPNTAARIIAVKFHDIHHILTEYEANWQGEVEIGAWEIASGCGAHTAAWLLNLGSLCIGLFLFPKSMFRAFMLGCAVKKNLYVNFQYEDLLTMTVGELRTKLGMNEKMQIRSSYIVYFSFWMLVVLLIYTSIISVFVCFYLLCI